MSISEPKDDDLTLEMGEFEGNESELPPAGSGPAGIIARPGYSDKPSERKDLGGISSTRGIAIGGEGKVKSESSAESVAERLISIHRDSINQYLALKRAKAPAHVLEKQAQGIHALQAEMAMKGLEVEENPWESDDDTNPGVKSQRNLDLDLIRGHIEAPTRSTRRGVYLALAGLGALSAASCAGTMGLAALAEYFTKSTDHSASALVAQTCDTSADTSAEAEPDQCIDEEIACEASPIEAPTLYGKVEAQMSSTDARLTAAATNELVGGLYADASSWQDLNSTWKDDTRAYTSVVKKLETWGGYDAVLESLAA